MKITYQQYIDIKNQYTGRPNCFPLWLSKNYNDIYNDIISYGSFYKDGPINFVHRLIWYFCNIENYPVCSVCGKENHMRPNPNLIEDYIKYPIIYFCKSHYYSSEYYQTKLKNTFIERFGVDNPNKLQSVKDKVKRSLIEHYGEEGLRHPSIRNKTKNTCIERYGVEYTAQNESTKRKIKEKFLEKYNGHPLRVEYIKEKVKKTSLQHFGTQHWMQNEAIKKKVRDTTKLHYGVEYSLQSPIVIDKIRTTLLNRYGVDSISKCKEIRNKAKETVNKKYGVDYTFQSSVVKDLIKQTILEKYGCENPSQNKNIHDKQVQSIIIKKRNDCYERLTKDNNEIILLDNKLDFLAYCENQIETLTWKCNKCNNIFYSKRDNNWGGFARCPYCYPVKETVQQINVCNILNDKKVNFEKYNRSILSGKEIDIYIPEKKLAIELDGLYWHSDIFNHDKNYHLEKTIECAKQGIQLIHIFEDEWQYKQDVVISRICSNLNLFNNKLDARKCTVKEISKQECDDFISNYHINGYCNYEYSIGLLFDDELVSIMTFTKNYHTSYTMTGYCCKNNYNIRGGASKLLNFFRNQQSVKEIIAYSDIRWDSGILYRSLNFQKIETIEPKRWYVISNKRYEKKENCNLFRYWDCNQWIELYDIEYSSIYDCGYNIYKKIYH